MVSHTDWLKNPRKCLFYTKLLRKIYWKDFLLLKFQESYMPSATRIIANSHELQVLPHPHEHWPRHCMTHSSTPLWLIWNMTAWCKPNHPKDQKTWHHRLIYNAIESTKVTQISWRHVWHHSKWRIWAGLTNFLWHLLKKHWLIQWHNLGASGRGWRGVVQMLHNFLKG